MERVLVGRCALPAPVRAANRGGGWLRPGDWARPRGSFRALGGPLRSSWAWFVGIRQWWLPIRGDQLPVRARRDGRG